MALNSFNGGILIVSHDGRLISTVCEEIWICEEGKVEQFRGEYKDYRAQMVARLRKKSKLVFKT